MAEPFRFPDELIAQGLAKCDTIDDAMAFAYAVAVMEAFANIVMPRPRPPRRRWWRRA